MLFPGCYAFLGQLNAAEYSNQRCIVKEHVAEKDRWAIKLWDPKFKGKQILVRVENITFDCFARAGEDLPKLPSHLRVSPAGVCGNGLFCEDDWPSGKIILEEDPLMVVANRDGDSGFEARWNLYFALENDRGVKDPTLRAFREMSDGGNDFVKRHIDDATTMFKKLLKISGRNDTEVQTMFVSPEYQDFVNEEILRISAVLARWQANSHGYSVPSQDRSALFRYTAKMQHSCDPNCSLHVHPETGRCVVTANRPIRAGDQLTNSYMGESSGFHEMNVEARRKKLATRGFVCICDRCVRESE